MICGLHTFVLFYPIQWKCTLGINLQLFNEKRWMKKFSKPKQHREHLKFFILYFHFRLKPSVYSLTPLAMQSQIQIKRKSFQKSGMKKLTYQYECRCWGKKRKILFFIILFSSKEKLHLLVFILCHTERCIHALPFEINFLCLSRNMLKEKRQEKFISNINFFFIFCSIFTLSQTNPPISSDEANTTPPARTYIDLPTWTFRYKRPDSRAPFIHEFNILVLDCEA